MEELIPILEKLAEAVAPLADSMSALSSAMGPAMQATAAFSSGIKEATGLVTGAFGQMVGAIQPFVAALSPNMAFQMQQAMRSLQATIGVALMPAAQAIVGAMRQVAGAILPAAQALAPVLGDIARVVTDMLLPPFYLISDILTGLAPVLQLLSGMAKSISDGLLAMSAVSRAVVQAFVEWIASLFGSKGDIKDFLSSFRDAVHRVVSSLIQLSAYIAKFFGRSDIITKMAQNLRDLANPKPGAPPPPTDMGFRGFEDIAKTMAAAAFGAVAGGNKEDTEIEWLKSMAGKLDEIKNNGVQLNDFWEKFKGDFEDWLLTLPRKIADAIVQGIAPNNMPMAAATINGAWTASPIGALASLIR